jgi:hypothetical protein
MMNVIVAAVTTTISARAAAVRPVARLASPPNRERVLMCRLEYVSEKGERYELRHRHPAEG